MLGDTDKGRSIVLTEFSTEFNIAKLRETKPETHREIYKTNKTLLGFINVENYRKLQTKMWRKQKLNGFARLILS